MESRNLEFQPLLFGGDINVYSMARAFHEAYGVRCVVYGKFPSSPCAKSAILEYRVCSDNEDPACFRHNVEQVVSEYPEKKILLLGCGDSYVKLAAAQKEYGSDQVIAPYIDLAQIDRLTHKEYFYDLCRAHGLDCPETIVHRRETGWNFPLPFPPPYIIKPSNGVAYWAHPFPIQNKVYTARSRKRLEDILQEIYRSGYDDSVVIQEFIPGDDTHMRVLTNYSDRNGQVKMMALGHVLLEEHSPHGIGNHTVIMTERNEAICQRIKDFLEAIGFVGFSNFDMKYDQRDGKYKLFEINVRQGRSNYYVTGAGCNLASLVAEDQIYGRELDFTMADKPGLWMVIPRRVAFRFIKPDAYRKEMRGLIRAGHMTNPLFYRKDCGPRRMLWVLNNHFRYYAHYKKYPKNGGGQ